MFLKNVAGSYEPAYFIIRIDADELPESLLEANEPTFIHEYVHLLQDLVLPYCMRENMVRLESFLLHVQQAKQAGEIRRPSEPYGEEVELVKRIAEATWGATTFHRDVSSIHGIDMTEETVDGKEYRLRKYFLSGDTVNGYQLGARDLLEYIAFKIESRHFPGQPCPPDLPYRSVDLVLEYKGLSFLSDVKRVALAEYCLANDNPAQLLMVMIDEIQQGHFGGTERGDDDPFITLLLRANWNSRGVPHRTVAQKLVDRYSQLRETMQNFFPAVSFPAIYAWLDQALAYAQDNLAGRGVFATLYEMKSDEFRFAISRIVQNVGVPLVENRHHSLGTSLGDEASKGQFIQLLLAYEFPEYLKREESTCPLYGRCEIDSPHLIDEADCLDAPFRRAKRKQLCPFGVFAKATGLAEVRWYTRDRLVPSVQSGLLAVEGNEGEDEDDE